MNERLKNVLDQKAAEIEKSEGRFNARVKELEVMKKRDLERIERKYAQRIAALSMGDLSTARKTIN